MLPPPPVVDEIIDRTLREDLCSGDVTTAATVREETRAVATAIARERLVVCGMPVFLQVFSRVDPRARGEALVAEGTIVEKGAILARVEGPARSLLMGERTALNFVQRMSGVATIARAYVDAIPKGAKARVVDTRKTTPGLRPFERYAVRTGGAHNHRDHLGSAVLIKDNHIVAAGGIGAALERARAYAPHTSRLEIEVQNLKELDEALAHRADVILLDNFSLADLATGVKTIAGRALVEASGRVNLTTIADIAETGVDLISVGALTHSAKASDIALDLVLA